MRRASPHVGAMGFSQWMARTPAWAHAITISACKCGHVQMETTSGFADASIS